VEEFLITAEGMHMDLPEDLSERSFRFSCDTYDYCEELVRLKGLPCRLANQLFDAAGSVGANRAEAKSAYTDREFAAKNAIVLREAREARFWLRLADVKSLGDRASRRRLLHEAEELVSICTKAVQKLKAKVRAERHSKNQPS
jgi:four helix bundle protein